MNEIMQHFAMSLGQRGFKRRRLDDPEVIKISQQLEEDGQLIVRRGTRVYSRGVTHGDVRRGLENIPGMRVYFWVMRPTSPARRVFGDNVGMLARWAWEDPDDVGYGGTIHFAYDQNGEPMKDRKRHEEHPGVYIGLEAYAKFFRDNYFRCSKPREPNAIY